MEGRWKNELSKSKEIKCVCVYYASRNLGRREEEETIYDVKVGVGTRKEKSDAKIRK